MLRVRACVCVCVCVRACEFSIVVKVNIEFVKWSRDRRIITQFEGYQLNIVLVNYVLRNIPRGHMALTVDS
jgi:hypothetical protein